MKILLIHSDFIEFEAKKKAFKAAEEGIPEGKQRVEECLVVLTAVEKRDESNPEAVVQRYVQEIKNVAQQVNAQSIVLYPYAHLSSNLGKPDVALQIMKDAEELLKQKFAVARAPFGWYKSFNFSCKGHPLSELSREFSAEPDVDLSREYKDEAFVYEDRDLSSEEKLNISTALIVGKAVKDLYPGSQVGGLGLKKNQAFVDIGGVNLRNDDLNRIGKQVHKIINADITIESASFDDIQDDPQRQILKDIGKDKQLFKLEHCTVAPMYKAPFVASTRDVIAFKVLNLASAYWKGNEKNQQLVRISCAGFVSKEKLQEFNKKQEDAENRSHLKIGKAQGLFMISELVGPGLPLLAPKGMILRNEIVNFLWELHKDKGYSQVWTPHIAKDLLYKKSGHWDKFGDELLKVKGKSDDFVMKPMNCPHHMQIFDNFSYSYRDMPIRFFEPATVYRDEKSGQLIGLARVRSITQDDGHLFCRVTQITEEAKKIVDIIHEFYRVIGMDNNYWVSLSVRGDDKSKYLGEDESWNIAEEALEKAAKEASLPYQKIEGEAAFYGPKLDFMFNDALGREWQLATVQCDFNLPERFDLSFMNEKSLKERPVVIHRAITGALERFLAVLIEHYAGEFPLWLNPMQVKLVTITDRSKDFALEVYKKLRSKDIRVELDDRAETMGRKVRDAQQEKVNYIVTIGDKEIENSTLAVRDRSGKTEFGVKVEDFISQVVDEIDKKITK